MSETWLIPVPLISSPKPTFSSLSHHLPHSLARISLTLTHLIVTQMPILFWPDSNFYFWVGIHSTPVKITENLGRFSSLFFLAASPPQQGSRQTWTLPLLLLRSWMPYHFLPGSFKWLTLHSSFWSCPLPWLLRGLLKMQVWSWHLTAYSSPMAPHCLQSKVDK